MVHMILKTQLLVLLGINYVASAIKLDLDSEESIKSVAGTIVYDMMTYYHGNESGQIPGILPGPPPRPEILNAGYFWWEAGAMWGSLIDYWYYTGDQTYNEVVKQGILFQTGTNHDFLPQNQSNGMGNDDQGFWALTAMSAAELKFPDPPADQPQWLALAQAVFNVQAPKIDGVCGGGLRWQAYSVLNGYNYKNSIANGCFFNLAARLAAYTGNSTYATYAENTWTWMRGIGLMDDNYNVYDGAHVDTGCKDIYPVQFSYNSAIFTLGAATMYSYTNGSSVWKDRLDNILNATIRNFFPNGIGYEIACEEKLSCTIDMFSEKAYLARWLAATTKVAPYTYDLIMPNLRTSAEAAALQCSGGTNGRMCGLSWSKKDQWDGTSGVGQQMAALEVILGTVIKDARPPVTNSTGGTSVGDPAAGTGTGENIEPYTPPTTGDKAGAGIVSAVVLVGMVGAFSWISL